MRKTLTGDALDTRDPAPPPPPLAALSGWMLSSTLVMTAGVVVAKLSQLHGRTTWTPGAVWGAALVLAASGLFLLFARLVASGLGRCGTSRFILVLSTVLVFMCAWASLIVVFAVDVPWSQVRP